MPHSTANTDHKVGDPVWVFDQNRRDYRPGQSGPIWRSHWVKKEISGETSRSWIVGRGGWDILKIPKKGPKHWGVCWSEEEIDRRVYVEENSYKISEQVRRVTDYETLLRIAEIVGYKPK